jgi:hypothetical protein
MKSITALPSRKKLRIRSDGEVVRDVRRTSDGILRLSNGNG